MSLLCDCQVHARKQTVWLHVIVIFFQEMYFNDQHDDSQLKASEDEQVIKD